VDGVIAFDRGCGSCPGGVVLRRTAATKSRPAGYFLTVFASNRRVADALDVPPVALTLWIYLGFVLLAVGGMAKIVVLGYVAMIGGAGILVVGLRAAIRPPRPFDPGTQALPGLLRTTRAVGVFYALAGLLWMLLSLGVVGGG
jgi:hypothetical protein